MSDNVLNEISGPPPSDKDLALLAKHRVLTVDEVSRLLRVSRNAAYQAVWSGLIPSVKIGRAIRVPVAAVKAMLGEPVADDEHGEAA
jgi:excisionase family DNA binding protein